MAGAVETVKNALGVDKPDAHAEQGKKVATHDICQTSEPVHKSMVNNNMDPSEYMCSVSIYVCCDHCKLHFVFHETSCFVINKLFLD